MIIIGEKINGSIPSVAKAIAERDADWIRNLAKIQTQAAGAPQRIEHGAEHVIHK